MNRLLNQLLQETTAFHSNGTVVVDGAQTFHNVFQFPDISRPVVSLEELQNIRVNGNDVCIMFGIIFLNKIIGQFSNIFFRFRSGGIFNSTVLIR